MAMMRVLYQDGDDKETLPECSIHSQLRLGSKEEEIFQYSFDNMLRTARRCERLQQDQLASPKTYPDVLLNYDKTKCAACPFPCTSAHELTAGGAGPGLTSVTGAWWSSALPPPRPAKMLSKPTGSCIVGRKKPRATISLSLRHSITRGGLSIAPPPSICSYLRDMLSLVFVQRRRHRQILFERTVHRFASQRLVCATLQRGAPDLFDSASLHVWRVTW